MDTAGQVYRFGPFESRPASRELYKHGLRLKIRPQPLRVLNLLLSRAGEVVSRETLREQLWSSETFVDFEHSLNTAVKELRAVLGDSPLRPRYIQTLPKAGYRFVGLVDIFEQPLDPIPSVYVHHLEAQTDSEEAAELVEPRAAERIDGRRELLRPTSVAVALVLLIGMAAGGYFLWARNNRGAHASAAGQTMLAVLPFENLTGDSSQEYFNDGLTEEMIAQLGRVDPQHLGVIARTSVMHYKQTKEATNQIGRELGVEYLLEGSVRREADKVRITAQLIRARDQTHVWSHQYDRTPDNLLSLQGEIAQEISDAIELTIGNPRAPQTALAASSPAPKSYEALDLYLQGRYFWNKRTQEGFYKATDCFQRAIAKDPGYARAYAGLADSYALMAAYYVAPQNELIPKARAAALKSLELDESLAEAHTSLALIAQNYDWDWQTADKEFRRAIALDPNYATGHHWYAEHLAFQGRFEEAFRNFERARQLDPLSLIIQTDHAVALLFARQYDRAIAQLEAVKAVEPGFSRASMVGLMYARQGRTEEALADVAKFPREEKHICIWIWHYQTYIYGLAGRQKDAEEALDKLLDYGRHEPLDPMIFVVPYIGVGDKDQALSYLEKSIATHSPGLVALKVDPVYDPLRGDPRFQNLLRRVGLSQ